MKSKKKSFFIAVCVLPAFILYVIFGLYPCLQSIKMAFYKWSGLSPNVEFVGLKNFITLFNDDKVWQAFGNNIILLAIVPLITMSLSLLFAYGITKMKFKEKDFYRVVFFFPNVLSLVVISILFMFIYHPTLGIMNSFLNFVGLGSIAKVWLGDSKTVLWAISIAMVWQAAGYYMVLYTTAMEGVPNHLYEAAVLDGASHWVQFRKITLPLIWEVMRVTIIFNIIGVFNGSFAFVNIMTKGGPDNSSNILSVYMYWQAFEQGNFGYAMAIGILILAISLSLAFLANKLTQRETIQY
ncbi:sugar ABC transporter permease [Acidaminobacter sp. JC074]|uniref:carbohydrate ABC transporter permease n=1 Tax=Acidaminobacter sp. JC074 TaxID=2530199 RepID=UPI001F0F3846|nr:sugar ABC transporter permease [Acidaminobacter sp. JC074]MCH4889394.1 sugar ABC transporter permease [Acidaminobacter sp. JC074]